MWELDGGACVATFRGHEGGVRFLAVLVGGRLASGSADRRIRIWDPSLADVLR